MMTEETGKLCMIEKRTKIVNGFSGKNRCYMADVVVYMLEDWL